MSEAPLVEAKVGPASGSKAARVEWVLNGSSLLVSGFGRYLKIVHFVFVFNWTFIQEIHYLKRKLASNLFVRFRGLESFLPKLLCDIKIAEIAKTYRLTKDNRIEKISFSVPRVKVCMKFSLENRYYYQRDYHIWKKSFYLLLSHYIVYLIPILINKNF